MLHEVKNKLEGIVLKIERLKIFQPEEKNLDVENLLVSFHFLSFVRIHAHPGLIVIVQ